MEGYNFIDLFAGCGGLSEGFYRQGFRALAHVEIDPAACKTLRTRMKYYGYDDVDAAVLEMDITRGDVIERIEEAVRGREVDLIIGGPPCQAYSSLGRAKDDHAMQNDPRNYLFESYVKVLNHYKPKFFVFENVTGMLTAKIKGEYIVNKILAALGENYKVKFDPKMMVLNSVNYGVPQIRKRVIILGVRKDIGVEPEEVYAGIVKTHYEPEEMCGETAEARGESAEMRGETAEARGESAEMRGEIAETRGESAEMREETAEAHRDSEEECLAQAGDDAGKEQGLKKYVTVRDAIGELPPLHPGQGRPLVAFESRRDNEFLKKIRKEDDKVLRDHVARNHNERDIERYKVMSENHWTFQELLEHRPDLNHEKQRVFGNSYVVQWWDLPSKTIIAHLYKDGNQFIHPDSSQGRTFTVREAARLQSFPDDFVFEGPRTEQFKQVGNAVPPLFAEAIARCLKEKLAFLNGGGT